MNTKLAGWIAIGLSIVLAVVMDYKIGNLITGTVWGATAGTVSYYKYLHTPRPQENKLS